MDRDKYTIIDYFGPYPIDWEMYDMLRGIKPIDKIDLKINRPHNINEIFDEHMKNFGKKKNPKK